ncbi:Uncharacterised protein [uncultured Bacteroides sp.]|jgi:DNA-binding NarL/FixJ family response regulator|uniref:response regulator n=1 Tax=Bacteroides cellulolyticus TaxID=2981780 RepID=UPI000822B083|nr:response regulator [Bacteroides cellulolyticus]MCU6770285.1 response regulator [Bacteroides cellulolyticus]SCH02938.1 Uncharacterised protein [uncultured Bacteroides sp.]
MRVLFVEDDDNKRNSVIAYLSSVFKDDISISIGMSIASGVQLAIDEKFDVIILDMTIPNFDKTDGKDGGQSFKNGGEFIIRELIDEGVLFKCLILTQYETFNNETIDQISERIKTKCGVNYLGYVKYNKLNEEWKGQLVKLLQDVKNFNNR